MEKIKKFLFHNTSTKQTIAKNTFWLFFSELLSRFLKIFLIFYATRVLGKESWGVFSYALSLVSIFMIFSDMGISTFVTNKASGDSKDKDVYVSTAFYLKMLLILVSFILVIILGPVLSKIPEANTLLPILALVVTLDAFRSFFICIVRANQKMEQEGFIKIIVGAIVVITGFYFLLQSPTPMSLALSYTLGGIVGVLLIIVIIFKSFLKTFRHFSKEKIREIWNFSWPITIIGLFSTIMFNIDTYALGIWRTPGEIGLYSASQKLVQFFYIIPGLFGLVLFPLFSKFAESNFEKLILLSRKTMKLIFLLSIPIAIGGFILSKELLRLSFGGGYVEASQTLSILMLSVIFVFPNFIFDGIIISLNKQKKFITPIIIGLIINIILNIILIPRYGIEGGAMAIVICQAIISGMTYTKLKKVIGVSLLPDFSKMILSNIFLTLLLLLLQMIGINIFITITVSILAYVAFLYIIKEPLLKEMDFLFKKK